MSLANRDSNIPTNVAEVDAYLDQQSGLDLLRFITCGSVDDGKSTLIGRMLYEAQLVFEDQVAALQRDSKKQGTQGGEIDFALLVDGLAAEREQGITIDVAYRFFGTEKRKFIVADTPGHEQYTRNMVTGASTADVAVILVDASQGLLTQTRRHSFITSLLGIPHVVLAVNKMDLVDYDQEVYDQIVEDYAVFAEQLQFQSITAIPLSALRGDNVITRSRAMSWYQGPTLLGFLETVEVRSQAEDDDFYFPVQWVNRPSADFRGFSGTVAAGSIRVGDQVQAMPSGQQAAVKEILLFEQSLDKALPDQSVTVTLDREIDISRGDVLVAADQECAVSDQFDTTLVWMAEEEGLAGRAYRLMIGSQRINATLTEIKYKYNVNTLEQLPSSGMGLNDIGRVSLSTDKPIAFASYADCPAMGSFIVVDRYTHSTIGAGMINFGLRRAQNIYPREQFIDRQARRRLTGHASKVFWFTGLSGAGKSTIAEAFERALHARGVNSFILDGDNVRSGLSKDLGFTDSERVEHIRRTAEVAKLMMDAGIVVIAALISPFKSERDMVRERFDADDFVEVFLDVSLEEAERRDPKGLYRKARRGDLPHFTGIDSPYEAPTTADLRLNTVEMDVDTCIEQLLALIETDR